MKSYVKRFIFLLACVLSAVLCCAFLIACHSDSSPQHIEAKAATCIYNGNIEYWIKDGKYYDDEACSHEVAPADTVIKAKGHDFESGQYVSSDPMQHWKVCARPDCDELSTKDYHFYSDGVCECGKAEYQSDPPEHIEAKAATCIYNGNIEYWIKDGRYYDDEACSHEITLADTVIKAKGHDFESGQYVSSDPTRHWKVCARPNCNTTSVKENHAYADGVCACGKDNGFGGAQLIVGSRDMATRTDTASSVIITVKGYSTDVGSVKLLYTLYGFNVGDAFAITYKVKSTVSGLIAFETQGDDKNDDNKIALMGGEHLITAYGVVHNAGDVVAVLKFGNLPNGSRLEFTEITYEKLSAGVDVSSYNIWTHSGIDAAKTDNGDGTFNIGGTGDGTDWHIKVEQRLSLQLGTVYDMLYVIRVNDAINLGKNLKFEVDDNAAAFADESNLFWHDRGNGTTVAVRFRFTAVKTAANHYSCLSIGELTDARNPINIDFLYINLIKVANYPSFPSNPEEQENAHTYTHFFLPEKDWGYQGYVGDTMPYYENGKYYVYYLKDGGDARNHAVYLATTEDFVTWHEYPNAILTAGDNSAQDSWIGTGSVVKVGTKYYFFYTGHNSSGAKEYHETIMVAEGTSPTKFAKKSGWQITPPSSLGQKNDFRDPQAYYDSATDTITLTITASQDGVARIIKYTLRGDLTNASYGGIIFTNPVSDTVNCFNLECSDTFRIGNKWYLTFSAQDDTLWYTAADTQYGPYTAKPKRLDGKIFYAAKHVSDGTDTYMVGWVRRSDPVTSTEGVGAWAGNMLVQKVVSDGMGGIYLAPVDAYLQNTIESSPLCSRSQTVKSGEFVNAFFCLESYVVSGEFTYGDNGDFGFAFDYDGATDRYKLISISPARQTLSLKFNNGTTAVTEVPISISPNKKHSFAYVQEGSVGIMYFDGQTALTVRLYGTSGKAVKLFAENNTVAFDNLKQLVRC